MTKLPLIMIDLILEWVYEFKDLEAKLTKICQSNFDEVIDQIYYSGGIKECKNCYHDCYIRDGCCGGYVCEHCLINCWSCGVNGCVYCIDLVEDGKECDECQLRDAIGNW